MNQPARILIALLLVSFSALAKNEWRGELAVEHALHIQQEKSIEFKEFAISPHLDQEKKNWLLQRMNDVLLPKVKTGYTFALKDTRVDGDLAMALVEISMPDKPMYVAVQPVAYCMQEGKWLPAPLWHSFEMTGHGGFDTKIHEKRRALESWGFQRSNTLQNEIIKHRHDEFYAKVAKYADAPELHKDRESAVLWFIEQVKNQNMAAAGACLGVDIDGQIDGDPFAEERPLNALFEGMTTTSCEAWSKLRSGNYLLAPMKRLKDYKDLVSIATFFPDHQEREQILEFEVGNKVGKRWVVKLPNEMRLNDDGGFHGGRYSDWSLRQENRKRTKQIVPTLISSMKHSGCELLSELMKKVDRSLTANDFRAWCELIDWSAGTNAERKKRFYSGMNVWMGLRKSSGMTFQKLEEFVEGDAAIVSILEVPNGRPQTYKVRDWAMRLIDKRWCWRPDLNPKDEKGLPQAIVKQYLDSRAGITARALKMLCAQVEVVNTSSLSAMAEDAKESLLTNYRSYAKALAATNLTQIFSQTACVTDGEGELLRAVGADLRGGQDSKSKYQEVAAFVSGSAGGVMVSLTNADTKEREYLLYLGCMGAKGPRLLPQMIYFYEHGKGQEILNQQMAKDILPLMGAIYQKDALEVVAAFKDAAEKEMKKAESSK